MRTIAGFGIAFLIWVRTTLAPCSAWTNPLSPPAITENILSQRAYIWQRVWTPALRTSIASHGSAFSAFDVLAAEITFTPTEPQVVVVQPDWTVLRSTGGTLGLVVRVGTMRAKTTPQKSKSIEAVIATCTAVLARAQAAGVEPDELQIDFDARTQDLAAYREWLHRLRQELHPRRLVITALPAWLSSPDFATLTREITAYVLQVHSIDKPAGRSRTFVVCDAARSRQWIHQADTMGSPFRVALPTYGYRVGFGSDGNFIGLQAEGSERTWPVDAVLHTVMPDHPALAALVRDDSRTAEVLHTAGLWLAAQDSSQANRFYQSLVLRCPHTDLGRDAASKHWFVDPAKYPSAF